MSLSVVNNVTSLNAQYNLSQTTSSLSTSLERLSSGLKINTAADNPAGLVISEQQRSQIAGLNAAIQNTSNAVDVVQTAEGALNEVNTLLTQIRSLALDAANTGVNDSNAAAADQAQITNALSTITSIATTTQFGNKKLLDGSAGVVVTNAPAGVAVSSVPGSSPGTGAYTLAITTAGTEANGTGSTAYAGLTGSQSGTLLINNTSINLNAANAGTLSEAIATINQYTGTTGVVASTDTGGTKLVLASNVYGSQGDFSVQAGSAAIATATGFSATAASETGTDIAGTVAYNGGTAVALTGAGNVLTGQGLQFTVAGDPANPFTTLSAGGTVNVQNNSLTFQIGANAGDTAQIGFQNASASALGTGAQGLTTGVANLASIDVTTEAGAQDAIRVVDQAVNQVTNQRGALGAFQANTLEANSNNLNTTLQNTTAAESTVRDTDYASEIANYTKLQIQQQAGTSVLSNANSISQSILTLIQKI
jgi:flagellin